MPVGGFVRARQLIYVVDPAGSEEVIGRGAHRVSRVRVVGKDGAATPGRAGMLCAFREGSCACQHPLAEQ